LRLTLPLELRLAIKIDLKPFATTCGNSPLESAGIESATSPGTLSRGGATMNIKSMLIGFFGILLVLAMTGSALAQSSKFQQLKVAVSTATPHNTPLWVAKDKKLFDKYGVDVQLIFVMGGSLVSQMLAAGEIQVAASSPAAYVSLIAGGEDIAAFLGISNTSPFALIAQPSIKKAADLRGKRLGTARFGGSSHVSALIALDHLGLDAKRDNIVLMQTGLDPERMAALEGKGLDAAMLQRLATKTMLSKGYTQLLNLNHAKIPYQNTVLASRRDYMAANPKLFDSFTRAIVEGYAYVFNKENKQAVKEVLAKNLRLPNIDAAEDFYLEAQEELDRRPYPTIEGTRTVIKFVAERNPKVASLKAERIVDLSWLKKLDDEGFFEKVYRGK
jgi:ABC-type nitrate/sulfonate/bicarbonate transport system substrate-binding protein